MIASFDLWYDHVKTKLTCNLYMWSTQHVCYNCRWAISRFTFLVFELYHFIWDHLLPIQNCHYSLSRTAIMYSLYLLHHQMHCFSSHYFVVVFTSVDMYGSVEIVVSFPFTVPVSSGKVNSPVNLYIAVAWHLRFNTITNRRQGVHFLSATRFIHTWQ